MTTTRILIIDEDNSALKAYQDALAPRSSKWTLSCASTTEEGMEAAKQDAPDIIIVSYSVNQDRGPALLADLERIAPNSQQFITATEDQRPALESTFGSNFQFLPSPCPAQRLTTEIQRCVAIDTWLGNERIKELVSRMGEFPSLPPIYLKVVNALNSRNASAQAIAEAISGDLAISAKVLQTVNSSYYGFDEKISNITQAVSILGTDCVKNLVLAIQVFDKMAKNADQQAITDELWHHSMSVAVAARRISLFETSDEKAAEEAYTAGLMHDIGKLVLLNAAPEEFTAARQLASDKPMPLWQAETETIGCNHAEIGAYLLARWGMPTPLAEAVALHHEPINSFGKSFNALAAVHVANSIVHSRTDADHPSAEPSSAYLTEIGRADSWENWLAVASGKAPRLKLSKNSSDEDSSEKSQDSKTEASRQTAPKKPQQNTAIQEPESESSKKGLIAIAASLVIAAGGIYLINTLGSSDDSEQIADAEAESKSSLTSSIEKARELSGLTQTEDALQEIFDSQDETVAPAEALATTETPQPAETVAETPQVSEEPEPEKTEVAAAPELPKPKISEPVDTFPKIILSGIFYNPDRPLASVNGQIRSVGDTVNGVKIVRIEKSRVVMQHEKVVRSFKLN